MASQGERNSVEAESTSSDINKAQHQVEQQTINQQSANFSESTSSANSTDKSARRALRVRNKRHRSRHTNKSDAAIDGQHHRQPEEKHDPDEKLMASFVNMSLFHQKSDAGGERFHTSKYEDSKATLAQKSVISTIPTKIPESMSCGSLKKLQLPIAITSIDTSDMHCVNERIYRKAIYCMMDFSAKNRCSPTGTNKAKPNTSTNPAQEYFPKSDKTTNSDKKPEIPRHEQERIDQLLEERSQPVPHAFNINQMLAKYEEEFPLWLVILQQGFNVMLHGMGSKRVLLDSFYRKRLMEEKAVVLQGFLPELNFQDVLDVIANEINLPLTMANSPKAIDAIDRKLRRSPAIHLFLLVHNLDGEPMRNERMQILLCRLASIPNVHIVATIDSISAPSMWSTSQLDLFNFSWRKVITVGPEATETSC